MTALYMHSNFGKKCVKFNLKREFDLEVALKLAGTCDVFVENFRPGKADSLGLGYEAVSKINPRIVYCSLSAYGSHGPRSLEAGADPHIQAASGFCSVTGQPGGRWEMYRQYAHLDITAAATVVQAVLVGLFAREMTGEGQRIETSMLGSAITLQATRLAEYFATGKSPVPMGSASAVAAPHEAFLCNDGQYLAVSAETRFGMALALRSSRASRNETRWPVPHQRGSHREPRGVVVAFGGSISAQTRGLVGDAARALRRSGRASDRKSVRSDPLSRTEQNKRAYNAGADSVGRRVCGRRSVVIRR